MPTLCSVHHAHAFLERWRSQTRSGGVVALAARERLQARFDRHHALFAAGAISVP